MPPVAAAFGALAAGTATAASIATVVSAVGIGLSVVGKVTGSESLMKIGGVMGLVGGAGALASGALGAASAAEGVAGATEGAEGMAEGGLGGMGGAMGQAGDYGMGALASDAATSGISAATDTTTSGLATQSPSFSDAVFESKRGGLLNSPAQVESTAPSTSYGGAQQNLDNQFLKSDYGNSAAPPSDTSSNGIKAWWNNQPEKVKAAIIQGGMGAVGGLFEGWTAEQKLALEREKMNLAQSNVNAQPVARFAPQTAQPKPGGLLYATRGM